MENKIYIIGIGPGSSEYLTKKAVDTVKTSDYTVGSTRAIDLFDDVNNKIAFNVKDLLDKLEKGVDLAIEGNTVSILSTGDPGFSGVLNTVLRIANEKNFENKIKNIKMVVYADAFASKFYIGLLIIGIVGIFFAIMYYTVVKNTRKKYLPIKYALQKTHGAIILDIRKRTSGSLY